jgi:hypothetical protein
MIPILQFDPATLTLWYDTQLLATARAGREIGLALHYALDGREDWLECLVREQSDPWVRMRCATVASSVWHEKRHFLDFVLPNYGALRVRHFFQCYFNTRALLSRTMDGGVPLLFPLDRNLDAQRREMLGISFSDPELIKLAEGIASAKRMLLDDREALETSAGRFEVGGEAILECIAYHVQLGKTHRLFGAELNARVQRDNPEHETVANKYQWATRILITSGLLRARMAGEQNGEQILHIDDAPMIPILYGALAGRFHGQAQTESAFASSYLPAGRLVGLVAHLDERKSAIADMSTVEAWDEVNAACKTLFGRTAIEEIDADFACEAELIARYEAAGTDETVTAAYADFHALRGRFIALLKADPAAVLDQARWADDLVNVTRPFVVAAAPAGVIGEPPEGFERLCGYSEENTDFEDLPDFRWWWTAIRTEKEDDGAEAQTPAVYRLSDQKTWSHIAADYAPMAKLMLDGNRMRAMVGPELVATKTRIERQTGVQIMIDPFSRYPAENFEIGQWYFLAGHKAFRCQVTQQIVQAPHGRLIGPWEFRRRPAFRKALLTFLGESQQRRMLRAIWRDWSPWLVCDEVGALFDAAKIDYDAEI